MTYEIYYRRPESAVWSVKRPESDKKLNVVADNLRREGYEVEVRLKTIHPSRHRRRHGGKNKSLPAQQKQELPTKDYSQSTRQTVFYDLCVEQQSEHRSTVGFLNEFEQRMFRETGNCTEDDITYAEQRLARIVEKAMAKYEVKHQAREPSHDDEWGER